MLISESGRRRERSSPTSRQETVTTVDIHKICTLGRGDCAYKIRELYLSSRNTWASTVSSDTRRCLNIKTRLTTGVTDSDACNLPPTLNLPSCSSPRVHTSAGSYSRAATQIDSCTLHTAVLGLTRRSSESWQNDFPTLLS